MLIAQILLSVIVVLTFFVVLSQQGTHAGKAWQKIFSFILVLLAVISIAMPSAVTRVANLLGIGRGTDLLVYAMFVAFLFYVVSQYLRGFEKQDKLVRLARRIAVDDAKRRYGLKG